MAAPVPGRIILGKVDAADSVPGPKPCRGLEKKTENGVRLASGDPLSGSELSGEAVAGIEVGAPALGPAPRALAPVTASAILGAAKRSAGLPGTNCAPEFKME